MAFYKLPFSARALMHNEATQEMDKEASVKQHLDLILATRFPEECTALDNFGSAIKHLHFLMPPHGMEAKWRAMIIKEVKDSIKVCLEKHEPRLHNPGIEIELIDMGSLIHDKKKKDIGQVENLPRGYVIKVQIKGRIKSPKGFVSFSYVKQIALG